MSEYGNLADTVGRMKRAAIDCWMADQSFYPNWGNDQIYAKWGWMLNFYNRPDENGVGGGDGNGVNDSVEAEFDQIRAAVDNAVNPWFDLPDGSSCESYVGTASAAGAILGSSVASASVQNSGEIATSNSTIEQVLINNVQGSFVAPFHDKYYSQLSKVTSGLGDACKLLETNYIAESHMWPAVRVDVAKICDNALEAWKQQADRAAAANGTMILTVVGAVAGAVASVLTAGGAAVAVAALGTVGVAATTAIQAISANAEVSGGSYAEILGSLYTALGKLNTVVHEQESALNKMLVEASGLMYGDRPSYNLDAFIFGLYPKSEVTITLDETHSTMISTNMGRIETALNNASVALGSAPASNPTPRGAGIGLGSSGTHLSASGLYAQTSQYLSSTVAEYTIGHELFDAVAEDYFETDAEVARLIADLMAEEALTNEATS